MGSCYRNTVDMKCTTNIIFLCIAFGFIDLVFSQLPTYGSSSSGGGVSRGRGNVGGGSRQGSGGFNRGSGSSVQGTRGGGGNSGSGGDHQGLDWLRDSVPGEPGVDYPIYGLPVPESSFSCDGRVVTTLTQSCSAKLSRSVCMTVWVVLSSTASCVLMGHYLTSSILCVTTGLMWIV